MPLMRRALASSRRVRWNHHPACETPFVGTALCTARRHQATGESSSSAHTGARRALRCPGGNRMTAQGIRSVLKVSSSSQLKRLDQRFMLNLKLTHQIMSNMAEHLSGQIGSSGGDGSNSGGVTNGRIILEIGPGPGALTRSLLTRQTAGVLGVEVDPRFNSYLEQIHQQTDGKFHWANADIMATDEYGLIEQHFPQYVARMEGGDADDGNGFMGNDGGDDEADIGNGTFAGGSGVFDGSRASTRPSATHSTTLRNGFHVPLKSTRRESILKRRQHLAFGAGSANSGLKGKLNNKTSAKGDGKGDEDGADDFFDDNDGSSKRKKERKALSEAEKVKERWASTAGPSLVVVSNLPFALSVGLLMRYSFDAYNKQGIYRFGRTPVYCLLPQQIANRLIALPPGTRVQHRFSKAAGHESAVNDERLLSRSYGRPSVLFQNYFHVRVHRLFSEKTFYPPVEILGSFVQLTPRETPLVDIDPATLIAFLDTTFAGRLRARGVGAALRQAMPAELASYTLQQLHIDQAVPIGQLTVREVALMAKVWERYMNGTNQSMSDAAATAREEQRKERAAAARAAAEAEAAAAAASNEKEAANGKEEVSSEEDPTYIPSPASPSASPSAAAHDDDDADDDLLNMMFTAGDDDNTATKRSATNSGTISDADMFAKAATMLDGDDEVIRHEGSLAGTIKRPTIIRAGDKKRYAIHEDDGEYGVGSGNDEDNNEDGDGEDDEQQAYGINPRDAFVNDAMDFFGLDASSNGGAVPGLSGYDGTMGGMGGADDADGVGGRRSLKAKLHEARHEGRAAYLRFKDEAGGD